MRILVLLRGAPGAGKSTWIRENGLENYTLSADNIRLLYRSPVFDKNGKKGISQSVNKLVWKNLFDILEYRMRKGEFTVIDACNSKTSEMNQYKSLADKYRYRMFCVDFTDIDKEQCKKQNASRIEEKQVIEKAIDLYYTRFKTQKIPSGIKVISRDNFKEEVEFRTTDLNEYKNVVIIGDIHGCYTALKEMIGEELDEQTYYVFVGDYLDRGLENKETLEFLIKIKDKSNVCLLEGNHDLYLRNYANEEDVTVKEFVRNTIPQIENVDKKEIRMLCRKLRQCLLFDYNNKRYLVTHAGISKMPSNLIYMATEEFINGVGEYEDIYTCQKTFESETDIIQIHGHRNPLCGETKQGNSYNLEGGVEYGRELRGLKLSKDGEEILAVKNTVFKVIKREEPITINEDEEQPEISIKSFVEMMRTDKKNIIEKCFGNISSFNFTRDVFTKKHWDFSTTKARGLFIDVEEYKIVARSYEKFFNINERPETKIESLSKKFTYPLTCFVKYNGYLGILGYDGANDKLLFCSKSQITKEYSEYFENIFMAKYKDREEEIKNYLKQNNVSMVFEVVDIINDPHIIEYQDNQLILLDIIANEIKFSNKSFDELNKVGDTFGFKVKEKALEINSFQDFLQWYHNVITDNYKYNDEYIEGFVIQDKNNFMVKIKCEYYKYWKYLRGVAQKVLRFNKDGSRRGYIDDTSVLNTPEMNLFYGFLRKLCENNYQGKEDIISLRNLFYKEKEKM
ncbi:MAG: metallophosphoesterase [Clostridia bacterium]|nr:metallophosphoesterase [Clostridia bacterium]